MGLISRVSSRTYRISDCKMDSSSDEAENLLEAEVTKDESKTRKSPKAKPMAESSEESGSDSESESDYDFTQGDLDALADKDPEFHKWMKSQHPDMLKLAEESKDAQS